jgi:hypothetical protein
MAALQAAVAQAVDTGKVYTADSWAAYVEALSKAQGILQQETLKQDVVVNATDKLNAAFNGLTERILAVVDWSGEEVIPITSVSGLEYMQAVAPFVKKGRLGMFILAGMVTEERVKMAAENGLQFLRVGAAAGDGKGSVPAVKMVKAAGLYCRYSLMKAYVCTPEELAEEAAGRCRRGQHYYYGLCRDNASGRNDSLC